MAKYFMENYNVVWDSQSKSSADSMPLGGYDVGCNVWAENGNLYLYISQSGTFDENNTMLKLGRIRIIIDDGDIFNKNFKQEFHLYNGYITIDAGDAGDRVHFDLWTAVNKSEVHINFYSERKHRLLLSFESWRYRERLVSIDEMHQCHDFDDSFVGKVITWPDAVDTASNSLTFWHRNRSEDLVWNKLIKQQQLDEIADKIPNPLKDRTMGGMLKMKAFKFVGVQDGSYSGCDHREYHYIANGIDETDIVLTLHTNQCETLELWKNQLTEKAALKTSPNDTANWWNNFFNKSYILIDMENPTSEWFKLGRNYQLFRYMLGCNYYGEYPTKFNGGLFTFDEGWTPDFRKWSGGSFTSQNQRLVYWGMLKAGDFTGMLPQFDYWRKLTESGKARVHYFWKHSGAFFFEQGNIFGICTGSEYNWNHSPEVDPALEDNPWVRLHWSSGLEFALMMLEYSRYTGKKIDEYMEYIESVIDNYFEHYPLDGEGKLFIFPSAALETYKGIDPYSKNDEEYGVENPMDAVAGLRCVIENLLEYLGGGEKYDKYKKLFKKCPDMPIGRGKEGVHIFLPARKYCEKPFNCELPELYPVFPYSPKGLSQTEKDIGINTYFGEYSDDILLGVSWHQNGIFAARLGLYDEALKYLHIKFDDSHKRFPAFWGPGHDWTPDHNHGGSGMILLQEMLMQCEGDSIRLLPTWDKTVDVSFKLFAPQGKVIVCELKNGMLSVAKDHAYKLASSIPLSGLL